MDLEGPSLEPVPWRFTMIATSFVLACSMALTPGWSTFAGADAQALESPDDEDWLRKSEKEWEKLLDSADTDARIRAVRLLQRVWKPDLDRFRPVVVRALGDVDPGVRVVAAGIMVTGDGPDVFDEFERRRALAELGRALGRSERRVRSERAIRYLGGVDKSWLAATLRDLVKVVGRVEDFDEWRELEGLFKRLGTAAGPAVGSLMTLLDAGDARTKERAAKLLGHIGEPARAAVPALIGNLKAPERDVAVAAHSALRAIAPGDLPRPSPVARFIPGEVATLEGPDMREALGALERLCRIGGQDAVVAVPAILRFLERCDKPDGPFIREGGLLIAGWVSRPYFGAPLLPALIAQVRDDRPGASRIACMLIGSGGADYADLVPEMLRLLERTNGKVKGYVADAFGSIGRDDPRVPPALLRAYAGARESSIRVGVLKGLVHLTDPKPEVFDAVRAARKDPDPDVRAAATSTDEFLQARRSLRERIDRNRRP